MCDQLSYLDATATNNIIVSSHREERLLSRTATAQERRQFFTVEFEFDIKLELVSALAIGGHCDNICE